jgi:hypothetical protein
LPNLPLSEEDSQLAFSVHVVTGGMQKHGFCAGNAAKE